MDWGLKDRKTIPRELEKETNVCWAIVSNGTQRALTKWALLGPALSHLVHLKLWVAMLVAPFLEQVLYLHLFT